jgi:hypothetical protein
VQYPQLLLSSKVADIQRDRFAKTAFCVSYAPEPALSERNEVEAFHAISLL